MNKFTEFRANLPPGVQRLIAFWPADLVRKLTRAWLDELAGLLPAGIRAWLFTHAQTRRVTWPLADSDAAIEGVVLSVPTTEVLIQRIYLPLVATRDIHQVLRFEIDKYTPYTSELVHFCTRIESRDSREARVLLIVITHQRLIRILEVCRARGLTLIGVEISSPSGEYAGINLLPESLSPRKKANRRKNLLLALIATALAFLVMQLVVQRQQSLVEQMRAEVTEQRSRVAHVEQLRQDLDASRGAAGYLAALKHKRSTATAVLADLTDCMGDDSWIDLLELNSEAEVSFSGQSKQASALITRMKRCSTVQTPQFQGVIQPDADTGNEQFSLRARLRQGGSDGPSAER